MSPGSLRQRYNKVRGLSQIECQWVIHTRLGSRGVRRRGVQRGGSARSRGPGLARRVCGRAVRCLRLRRCRHAPGRSGLCGRRPVWGPPGASCGTLYIHISFKYILIRYRTIEDTFDQCIYSLCRVRTEAGGRGPHRLSSGPRLGHIGWGRWAGVLERFATSSPCSLRASLSRPAANRFSVGPLSSWTLTLKSQSRQTGAGAGFRSVHCGHAHCASGSAPSSAT
jgi:hypothetical protein